MEVLKLRSKTGNLKELTRAVKLTKQVMKNIVTKNVYNIARDMANVNTESVWFKYCGMYGFEEKITIEQSLTLLKRIRKI